MNYTGSTIIYKIDVFIGSFDEVECMLTVKVELLIKFQYPNYTLCRVRVNKTRILSLHSLSRLVFIIFALYS